MEHIVFTGIGSNIDNPHANCLKAIEYLNNQEGNIIISKSSLYKTEPVGYSNQDWFVNCVLKLKTDHTINDFFEGTKNIENIFGGKSEIKWGPRKIDIDILFYNNDQIFEPNLIIPHPLIHKRKFVLIPMLEIAPNFIHPTFGKNIKDLLNDLKGVQKVVRLEQNYGTK